MGARSVQKREPSNEREARMMAARARIKKVRREMTERQLRIRYKGKELRDRLLLLDNKITLLAGESISLSFSGRSFLSPRKVDVLAIYKFEVNGVNPFTTATIEIVDEEFSQ